MPNWCFTEYVATGPKEQLQRLKEIFLRLEAMPSPGLVENGFGSTWLGNLVAELGEDYTKVYCRGTWEEINPDQEDELCFTTVTAWAEMKDVRLLIERKFPEVKLYFISEELGCGIFETNDSEHSYFDSEYYLWIDGDDDCDGNYYVSLEEVVDKISALTNNNGLESYEDCKSALEVYCESHDLGYSFIPISYVD